METVRQDALELARGLEPTASNIERVSKKTSPEAARWGFLQWELRKKAIAKGFPRASEMIFTREALEQATHFAVARYHASLFPAGELVADLTCGIGADLIAFAERGPVIGFDLDQERLEYARHNLAVHGLGAELVLGNCLVKGPDEDPGGYGPREWPFDYAFADPSRRVKGKRTLDIDLFSPRPAQLAERMRSLKLGLIKLSPMLDNKVFETLGRRVDFVSWGRECREALVNCSMDGDQQFNAVRVETGSLIKGVSWSWRMEYPFEFVYEADPAAARAGALMSLQSPGQVANLGTSAAYLTAHHILESEWVTGFHVLASGHWDINEVRLKLREIGCGRAVVKGEPGFDVADVSSKLGGEGSREAIVIIYPWDKKRRYAIVERI